MFHVVPDVSARREDFSGWFAVPITGPNCVALRLRSIRESLANAKTKIDDLVSWISASVAEDSEVRGTLQDLQIKLKPVTDKLGELAAKLPLPKKEDGSIGMYLAGLPRGANSGEIRVFHTAKQSDTLMCMQRLLRHG